MRFCPEALTSAFWLRFAACLGVRKPHGAREARAERLRDEPAAPPERLRDDPAESKFRWAPCHNCAQHGGGGGLPAVSNAVGNLRRSAALLLLGLVFSGAAAFGQPEPGPASRGPAAPSAASGAKTAQPQTGSNSSSGQAVPRLHAGAILPFQSLRRPEDAWIGDYLADVLRRRLETADTVALVSRDAASQYAARLALDPAAAPAPEQWTRLGLDYLVVGTVQRVLDRVAVKVRMLARSGDLTEPAPLAWTIDLAADTPERSAAPLLDAAAAAFKLAAPGVKPEFPRRWDAVQKVYGLGALANRVSDGAARAALVGELQPFTAEPGLAGRVAELEALLRLEQAMLTLQGEAQAAELKRALAAARRAVDEDGVDTERRALLGEIDYFMREDYLAKTEASVARLKNPLNGLAWAVLGLVAGPSSGEGTEQLKRARQAEPFLWPAARVPGTPPFQGGILDGTLGSWAALRDQGTRAKGAALRDERGGSRALLEGIADFEARRWDLADAAFREAASEDEYDYRPLLYRLRILIETGRSQEAVAPLRELQAENPLEVDVQSYLGVALERSGALDEARAQFQRILQDDPRQPVALYHLGLTAIAARAWGDALAPLRTLVGIQPGHEDAWLQLGIALANLRQWAPADEAFRRVLSLDPKSQPAREWRSRIAPYLSR